MNVSLMKLLSIAILLSMMFANLLSPSMAFDGDWVREDDGALSFRIRGKVIDSQGKPTDRFSLEVEHEPSVVIEEEERIRSFEFEGDEFEIWIPVRNQKNYGMRLPSIHVSSKGEHAYPAIAPYELREVALHGLNVVLQKNSRTVEVRILDEGVPVAGAKVQASTNHVRQRSLSDSQGVARFQLLPDEKLQGLMAWTNDFRIAGFGFDRDPYRDPALESYDLELDACREVTFRLIDESKRPVPGVPVTLNIATPSPDINFIGTHEPSSMITDANGEARYRWFPRWDAHYSYVEIHSEFWTTEDRNVEIVGGVATYRLKKTKFDERKRILGKVVRRNEVASSELPAGFLVTLATFQGETKKQSDVQCAYTNARGEFQMDVLPDSTYCMYLTDCRMAAQETHFIPYDSATEKTISPELSIVDGVPVEFVVTRGQDHKPLANLRIGLIKDYMYGWLENGQKKNGRNSNQWFIQTDAEGKARTCALPGNIRIEIRHSGWALDGTVKVARGSPNRTELHRFSE